MEAYRPTLSLRPLERHARLYADREEPALETSIREKGILEALLVTADDRIISGVRRWRAAQEVELHEVPVRLFDSADETDVLEALVLSNAHRLKSNEEIAREAQVLLEVERAKAARRQQQAASRTNAKLGRRVEETLVEICPEASRSREAVGKVLGLSGKTAERAVAVIHRIDELAASGEPERAEILRKALNRSINAGHRLMKDLGEPVAPENGFRREGGCNVSDLQMLLDRGERFATVYADPPWPYDNQATRAATDNHYVTLSLEQIAALAVPRLTTENAHLWLWTTTSFLREGLDLLAAWGFEYKTNVVWSKPQMGIGNYVRVSHEHLLLGVRGSCPTLVGDIKSWMVFDRTTHSSKPPEFRAMIERASPGPFLVLFGRRIVKGWTVWGNEILGEEYRQEYLA